MDNNIPFIYSYAIYLNQSDYANEVKLGSNQFKLNAIIINDFIPENKFSTILPSGSLNPVTEK